MPHCFREPLHIRNSIWIEADSYDAALFKTELLTIVEQAGKDPNIFSVGKKCKCDFVFLILKLPARKPFFKPYRSRFKKAIGRCSEATHAFILFTNVPTEDGWCSNELENYLMEECGEKIAATDKGLLYQHSEQKCFTLWSCKGSLSEQQRDQLISLFQQ